MSFEQRAKLFKTLMHPARLAILDVLRDGEQCVCHLEACLGLRQAYISQQLMVLRDAGLIRDRRDGWNIYYQVAREEVFVVIDAALALTCDPARLESRRTDGPACPCPKCKIENMVIREDRLEIDIQKG